MDVRQHWDEVYRQKAEQDVSWFQAEPALSLDLIRRAGVAKQEPIVDVGAGASRFVDRLLAEGYSDLTVLDIAEAALQKSRARLGSAADRVNWIAADVTCWQPAKRYRLWHDRAVFHFLTEAADRAAYRKTLGSALMPQGIAIIASFALDGPERCSGLPVQRYSPESLAAELGEDFRLLEQKSEAHITPAGKLQLFQYSVFRRKA
ncbi:MAG TPA: class I SAM-dependent methyltransferase [Gammaproteobacteria bacterium]|nr:class I SAM-dependent methyltransferase [Gammaproteobacteria bacterium]